MPRPLVLFALFVSSAITSTLAQSAPAATAPAAPATTATIKANAQLVVVDVVVTDKSLKPVHGLKAADFTIAEGNTPQVVRHFEEHSALTAADAAKFGPMPTLPPGQFTNYSPAPENGAVNLLLLDALNTPMKDQVYVRQQMLAYLKSIPPGTRIAIFGLANRLVVLQSFTSDPEVLKAVMTRGLSKASPLLDDALGGGGVQNSPADDMEDNGVDPSIVANFRQFEAQTETSQLQLRAQFTLDALNQIARYLSSIPGRKNLIWFSGSFPVNILPDITGTLPDPFAAMASSEDEFRDTVSLLARSQVAVYPIDARGLMTSPVFDASTSRNYGGPRGNARMSQDQTKFVTDTNEEHNTMQAMAEATGGRAFVDTNGLTKAVATAIDEGSNFYTLTYTPANYSPDGRLHKIKVEVDRQGVNLAYRRGYYADPPGLGAGGNRSAPPDAALTNTAGSTPQQALHAAMMRGAPLPSEILLKVAVTPSGPATQIEDKVAPGNIPAEKTKGPFRRYDVGYAINPSDILFRKTSDGKIHAEFDLIVFVFNPEGALVNSLSEGIRIAANQDDVQKAAAHGLLYNLQISAPAKGEYFLRIAVRDLQRDRYGAIEVATSQVKNLPAAPVPPATPAK